MNTITMTVIGSQSAIWPICSCPGGDFLPRKTNGVMTEEHNVLQLESKMQCLTGELNNVMPAPRSGFGNINYLAKPWSFVH